MTYELRHNPEAPAGSDNTVLYECEDCSPAARRVETFHSLEEAMLVLSAKGMSIYDERPVPPFDYDGIIYRNVRMWEVTA